MGERGAVLGELIGGREGTLTGPFMSVRNVLELVLMGGGCFFSWLMGEEGERVEGGGAGFGWSIRGVIGGKKTA